MKNLVLLPQPRQIEFLADSFQPSPSAGICIQAQEPHKLFSSAVQLAETCRQNWPGTWGITTNHLPFNHPHNITIGLDPKISAHAQSYHLVIHPDQIDLIGSGYPGIFYGIQTLTQLMGQFQQMSLPCMDILDWPDFTHRGVMLDVSRDKVYTLETLFMLIDEFASWKINQLQLYMEHTFAYQGHEAVWQGASPLTPDDIQQLDRYCTERFIEFVPNQNSLGHMTRWLKHPAYRHLAETTAPVQTPWGHVQQEPFSLAPTLPETLLFVSGLYDQLLPHFSSKQVNVGCDETFDIGTGKSKDAVQCRGRGHVYLEYLLALHRDLHERGYQMQFWGDIILEHPDLISQLPKDAIALDWGYEADHPFEKETECFKESGISFYVCPGTSSWNSLGGRCSNMLENCRSAARAGLENGACGYLNTDWGDNGHWQQLPISYPGFITGAALSWCLETNQNLELASVLNQIVFSDSQKRIGKILLDIGEEFHRWGLLLPNSSPLFWLLQEPADRLRRFALEDLAPIKESIDRLTACLVDLNQVDLHRPDAQAIDDELRLTIRLMRHACRRAMFIFTNDNNQDTHQLLHEIRELMAEFQSCWRQRNRLGGLGDSLSRFDILLNEYEGLHG